MNFFKVAFYFSDLVLVQKGEKTFSVGGFVFIGTELALQIFILDIV